MTSFRHAAWRTERGVYAARFPYYWFKCVGSPTVIEWLRRDHPHGLDLSCNRLSGLELRADMNLLSSLNLSSNAFRDFTFLDGRSEMRHLYLSSNGLTVFTLPEGLANL